MMPKFIVHSANTTKDKTAKVYESLNEALERAEEVGAQFPDTVVNVSMLTLVDTIVVLK